MNRSKIIESDILIRYLALETTDTENNTVENWLEESDENREYFEQVKNLWNNTADHKDLDRKYLTEKSWNKISGMLGKNKPVIPMKRLLPRVAIAASILLIAAIGISFFFSRYYQKEKIVESSSSVTKIILPDNSIVWLNRNTKLIYGRNFTHHRFVKLYGEGYFVVKHDAKHPFEITTSNSKITVLGTEFNVSAYVDSVTEVTVTSGEVKVTGINKTLTENTVLLLPGEKGVNKENSRKIQKETSDNPNYMSWKTHDFIFDNTNIRDIVHLVNNIYDTHIRIENDSVQNCNITGKYSCHSLDDMLDMLHIVLNINFEKKGDEIIINTAGC
jgi:transmembrane sensor